MESWVRDNISEKMRIVEIFSGISSFRRGNPFKGFSDNRDQLQDDIMLCNESGRDPLASFSTPDWKQIIAEIHAFSTDTLGHFWS